MTVVAEKEFRAAMARLASAVTLVATHGPAGKRGMVATAVTSVTDTPPTLLVCVNKSTRCNRLIKANGVFSVNILNGAHAGFVQHFMQESEEDRFADSKAWTTLKTGSPVLEEALANIDCELEQIVNIGTHSLFIGQVLDIRIGGSTDGLVYFDRAFCEVRS
jgi:flavin reductase